MSLFQRYYSINRHLKLMMVLCMCVPNIMAIFLIVVKTDKTVSTMLLVREYITNSHQLWP